MKTEMRLNDGMRDFLKYLAVALCSAIMTYLTTSPQPQDRNHFPDDGHKKSLFAKDLQSNNYKAKPQKNGRSNERFKTDGEKKAFPPARRLTGMSYMF